MSSWPTNGGGQRRDTTLRPMAEADVTTVLAIERALFPEDAWSELMFRDELEQRSTRHYLVAENDSEIVGYAGLLVHGPEADVQTLAVRSDYWGRGVGGRLLAALVDEAVRRRCQEVYLEVRADNDRAKELYRRFGFEAVGTRPGYYQQAGADAIVMRLVGPTDRERRTRAIGEHPTRREPGELAEKETKGQQDRRTSVRPTRGGQERPT